ncbi:MAG: alkaline phosphatase [Planctomycetota bacterium]
MHRTLKTHVMISLALLAVSLAGTSAYAQPKNVILLIGDGMGPEQVKAASLYGYGEPGKLFMQQLPVHGQLSTDPANGGITDSAAAGTAMATGVKVNSGTISYKDGEDLPTILEKFAAEGKSTGLLSTDSCGGATPASFGTHTASRKNYDEIYSDYYTESRPNLLWGGGWQQPIEDAESAGYTVIRTRDEMKALDPAKDTHVVGRFSPADMPHEYKYARRIDSRYDRVPHLSEMARAAVEYLSANEKGFFLMIEGGVLDHTAHRHMLQDTVYETLELDNAAKEVMRWAAGRNDTLVIVTADHETGGLKVEEPRGRGEFPEVTWSTGGHTDVDVPLFAWGVGAEEFSGQLDNTDIHNITVELPETDEVDSEDVEWDLTVSY